MYKSDRKSLLIIMYWLIYIFSGLCTEVIISESLTGLFWETRSNAFDICSETSIQKLEKKITTYLKCFIVALNVLHKIRERFHRRYSQVVVSVKFIHYSLLHLSGLELKFERQEWEGLDVCFDEVVEIMERGCGATARQEENGGLFEWHQWWEGVKSGGQCEGEGEKESQESPDRRSYKKNLSPHSPTFLLR